jgi:hypothetical protein
VFGVNAFQLIPAARSRGGALAWLSTHATVRTPSRANVTRAQITFDQEDRGFGKAVALSARRAQALGRRGRRGGHESRAIRHAAAAVWQGDAGTS